MVGEWMTERLPKNWHWILGVRAAITLAFIVALLSVVTAIVNISQPTVWAPVDPYVPDAAQEAAPFTGALTGFVMVGSALTLRRGLWAGWWTTLLLMPITAVQGVMQASQYSIPLIVFSLLSIPTLLATRRHFTNDLELTTTQLAAGAALAGVQVYGTAGAFVLRDNFEGINSIVDAFYFTLITSSTVGYGDITPDTGSAEAVLFTLSVLVLGVASFGIAIGALIGPVIQSTLSQTLGKMTDSKIDLLENHLLVLGYGDLTEPIVDELQNSGASFAVVTRDSDSAVELSDRNVPVVVANPSDVASLGRVHIERAKAVLVATNDDAEDALTILAARELRPDVRIVAAATDRENIKKLERAGADTVISPAVLGGSLLVRSAMGSDESGLVDQIIEGK